MTSPAEAGQLPIDGILDADDEPTLTALAGALFGAGRAGAVAPEAEAAGDLLALRQRTRRVAEATGARLLTGCRCPITAAGVPALDDWSLAPFDVVWATVPAGVGTAAVARAIEHPHLRGLAWSAAAAALDWRRLVPLLARRAVVLELGPDAARRPDPSLIEQLGAAGVRMAACSRARDVPGLAGWETAAAGARLPLASVDRLLGARARRRRKLGRRERP